MMLSLQTGNAAALEAISTFVSSSRGGSTQTHPSGALNQEIVDATQLCTDLARQTVLLEKQLNKELANGFGMLITSRPLGSSHPGLETSTVQGILRQSISWLVSAVQETDNKTKQSGIKVVQAVETFRRLVIRVKSTECDSATTKTFVQLLHEVATCFDSAFEQVWCILPPSISGLTGFTVRK